MDFLNKNFNAFTIIFMILVFFIVLIYFFRKLFILSKRNKHLKGLDIKEEQKEIDKKTMKMVDSDLKEVLEMWFNVDLKIIKINKVSESPDKRLAWFCFIEMMTRVVSNVFDENGKCKDVLNSTYLLFKNVRNYTLENVNANNSAKISLIYLNKILRPFLAKWDNLINGK